MSRAARGALAAAGGLAVTAATVWAAAFRTTSGASVDGAVLGGFLGLGAQDTVHALAARVARLADPPALALITSLIVCVALARRRIALAVAVVAVTAAANASTQALKRLTADPRPLDSVAAHVAPASWPSGHATAAMVAGLCLVAVAPARLRPLASALGAVLALGVGYAVLLLGWHFPSDVLGGYCVAAAWTLSGLGALRATDRAGPRHVRIAAAPAAAVLGALGIGAAFAGAALARTDPADVYAAPGAAFVAFALVIAAAACIPAAGLAMLLARSP